MDNDMNTREALEEALSAHEADVRREGYIDGYNAGVESGIASEELKFHYWEWFLGWTVITCSIAAVIMLGVLAHDAAKDFIHNAVRGDDVSQHMHYCYPNTSGGFECH